MQFVRDSQNWELWLIFILEGITETAKRTVTLINEIKSLMQNHKQLIRNKLPQIYSHELINNLYKHPYTKIDFVVKDCQIHRNTARTRLESLVKIGILKKEKIGKENFYINVALYELLMEQ